jgi:hypothetical protein
MIGFLIPYIGRDSFLLYGIHGLWGPPSLLTSEYGELFPESKIRLGHETGYLLPSSAEVKNAWIYIFTHTSSWHGV